MQNARTLTEALALGLHHILQGQGRQQIHEECALQVVRRRAGRVVDQYAVVIEIAHYHALDTARRQRKLWH